MALPANAAATTPAANIKETKNGIAYTTIKLRGVNIDSQYYMKEEEKETFKVLHQIEFNSFWEQAMHASSKVKNHMYDDYYYEDQAPSVFESN